LNLGLTHCIGFFFLCLCVMYSHNYIYSKRGIFYERQKA
jgi:hypothetical protein